MSKTKKNNGEANDSYLEMVRQFPLTSIRDDKHLVEAQAVLDSLFAREPLKEGEETYLEALSDLIAHYEEQHVVIGTADDVELLQHLMEAKGVRQQDVVTGTGIPKSTISELISGKRAFNRRHIDKFAKYFGISEWSFKDRPDED